MDAEGAEYEIVAGTPAEQLACAARVVTWYAKRKGVVSHEAAARPDRKWPISKGKIPQAPVASSHSEGGKCLAVWTALSNGWLGKARAQTPVFL